MRNAHHATQRPCRAARPMAGTLRRVATRVLHLIKGLGPGGAEQLLVNQAEATDAADLEFIVAYLVSWKNHLVSPIEDAGWATRCLGSNRPWDIRWLLRFRRLLKEQQVTVVHGHSPLVSAMARLALRTIGPGPRARSVYTEHNEWARHRPWTRRLNRSTIGLEDRVVAVSHAVRESMGVVPDVEVVVHGINVSAVAAQAAHRDAVREELGIRDEEIVVGIVANYRHEKAYDVLMDAASEVLQMEQRVRFVSIGQGPLEAEIRAHHERLDLGDRFLLLGYRDDAIRVMSAFDIFTLSSLYEGLPVALMEALVLDLPVVATSVGGVPEALAETDAILVPPGSSKELADALAEMLTRIGDGRATRRASPQYDMRVAAGRLADLYRELSEGVQAS